MRADCEAPVASPQRRLRTGLLLVLLALLLAFYGGHSRSAHPSPLAGAWLGTMVPERGAARPVLALFAGARNWVLIIDGDAADPGSMVLADGWLLDGEQRMQGRGLAFDRGAYPSDYNWELEWQSPQMLRGGFRRELGDGRLERGELALHRHTTAEIPAAPSAGRYATAGLTLHLQAAGTLLAEADADSSFGDCRSIRGRALAATAAVYRVEMEVDTRADPRCVTGTPNPLQDHFRGAILLRQSAACPRRGTGPNALTLMVSNGMVAHHFPLLCREL